MEVLVYTYILLQGAEQLAEGSEGLLEVSDPGFIGGLQPTPPMSVMRPDQQQGAQLPSLQQLHNPASLH